MKIALSLILAGLARPAFAEPVIQVRPSTELEAQKSVTVGDIADFKGFAGPELEALKGIRLGDAPRAGEARSFTNVGLSQIFRPYLREYQETTGKKVALLVPTRVTVRRKVFRLDQQVIEQELANQWKKACSDCEFEISHLAVPIVSQDIPAGSTWSIKLRPELPKGSFSAPIEVKNDDHTRRIYWISGQAAVRRTVPVAKRALGAGERLQPEDVAFESRDITYGNDAAADAADLKTAFIARSIGAGQVIWRSSVRREAALRAGETVKVVAGREEWQISIDGVAQQGGYLGELVKVKIPRTQKVVSGVLVQRGVVEVQ